MDKSSFLLPSLFAVFLGTFLIQGVNSQTGGANQPSPVGPDSISGGSATGVDTVQMVGTSQTSNPGTQSQLPASSSVPNRGDMSPSTDPGLGTASELQAVRDTVYALLNETGYADQATEATVQTIVDMLMNGTVPTGADLIALGILPALPAPNQPGYEVVTAPPSTGIGGQPGGIFDTGSGIGGGIIPTNTGTGTGVVIPTNTGAGTMTSTGTGAIPNPGTIPNTGTGGMTGPVIPSTVTGGATTGGTDLGGLGGLGGLGSLGGINGGMAGGLGTVGGTPTGTGTSMDPFGPNAIGGTSPGTGLTDNVIGPKPFPQGGMSGMGTPGAASGVLGNLYANQGLGGMNGMAGGQFQNTPSVGILDQAYGANRPRSNGMNPLMMMMFMMPEMMEGMGEGMMLPMLMMQMMGNGRRTNQATGLGATGLGGSGLGGSGLGGSGLGGSGLGGSGLSGLGGSGLGGSSLGMGATGSSMLPFGGGSMSMAGSPTGSAAMDQLLNSLNAGAGTGATGTGGAAMMPPPNTAPSTGGLPSLTDMFGAGGLNPMNPTAGTDPSLAAASAGLTPTNIGGGTPTLDPMAPTGATGGMGMPPMDMNSMLNAFSGSGTGGNTAMLNNLMGMMNTMGGASSTSTSSATGGGTPVDPFALG